MSGRWSREAVFRYVGQRELAAMFLPHARKVIAMLLSTMGPGVTTSIVHRYVAPGVLVTAQFVAGQPIATIDVTSLATPTVSMPWVVCTPRDDTNPDGIDATHPEVLLRWRQNAQTPPRWHLGFGTQVLVDTWPAAEPKETYEATHPDGVHYFGNIDWRGPNNERLSWYGPYSRYWPDRNFFNVSNTPLVFYQGAVLLHGPTVAPGVAELEGDVRGAALWRHEDAVFMHVIHQTGDALTLVRYTLVAVTPPAGAVDVAVSDYEIVSSFNLADTVSPVFFNASGTRAVWMTDPPHTEESGQPTSCTIGRLFIDDETGLASWSTEAAYYGSGDVSVGYDDVVSEHGYLALDFDGDEEVSIRIVDARERVFDHPTPDPRTFFNETMPLHGVRAVVDIRGRRMVLGNALQHLTRESNFVEELTYVDLRDETIVSWRQGYHTDSTLSYYYRNRVYRRGVVLAENETSHPHGGAGFNMNRWHEEDGPRNPRLLITANNQPVIVDFEIGGHNFGYSGLGRFWYLGFGNYAVYYDALGVPWAGFTSCERIQGGSRVVSSWVRVPGEDEPAQDRPAFNYLEGATFSQRLAMNTTEVAFFPGAPLGRPLFSPGA